MQMARIDNRRRVRSRGWACLLGAALAWEALASGAPARALEIEPLMLRVQDAVGAPGEGCAAGGGVSRRLEQRQVAVPAVLRCG